MKTTPERVRIIQRRSNLYIHTYAALDHPKYGQVLIPVLQSMYSRSKYMPHMGLKERIKALKSVRVRVPVDVLLIGDEYADVEMSDEQRPE